MGLVRRTVHVPLGGDAFEKSAGALGAHRARWDPFVNARASSADLAKLSKDGLSARARHTSRAVDLIQFL
jgi:hypothetical protein